MIPNDPPVQPPAIVLVGSVETSRITLLALLQAGTDVRAVFGLAVSAARSVAGYTRLDDVAASYTIPYHDFVRINDPSVRDAIASYEPDSLWIIGLSQLIGPDLIGLPRLGCVGFHPTRLPVGRGRAAMAWSILANVPLAATFFQIDEGVDAGPILAQIDVAVDSLDDVAIRYQQLYQVIPAAATRAYTCLVENGQPVPQDERAATYLGIRRPVDGTIDWERSSNDIARLVRASVAPHPGAWTYDDQTPIRVDRCTSTPTGRYVGVPGRIVDIRADGAFVVASADGALLVERFHTDAPWQPKVGSRLGYHLQAEIHLLRSQLRALEAVVAGLVTTPDSPLPGARNQAQT